MKNLVLLFAILFSGWSASASENPNLTRHYYNDSFIFVENGVEFAVYPNGEFDFYFNPAFRQGASFNFSTPNMNISYNSGYDYGPFVQYDDYGAVIQIENVPVYYDYYGRIIQAGGVFIWYNNFGRVARIGNMHVHYDRYHHYSHFTGFINPYNRGYGFRPWHRYYQRPHVNVSIVFNRPYRAYYNPHRVSYNQYVTVYNSYYVKNKGRRNFYRPSDRVERYNYGSRTSVKREIERTHTRSRHQVAQSRQQTARNRSHDRASRLDESKQRNESRDYTRGHRDHRVNTTRAPKRETQSRERSSDSRGRSNRIEASRPGKRLYDKRTPDTQRDYSGRISGSQKEYSGRSSRTETRSRSNKPSEIGKNRQLRQNRSRNTQRVETSSRTSERKAEVNRQSRKRPVSVRGRSGSETLRTGGISTKNSSRKRSSARNMNIN